MPRSRISERQVLNVRHKRYAKLRCVKLVAVNASMLVLAASLMNVKDREDAKYVQAKGSGDEEPYFISHVPPQEPDSEEPDEAFCLGCSTELDAEAEIEQSVRVPDISESDTDTDDYELELNAEDQRVLLKAAMAEAEGESTRGKALVMRVILNRVESDAFPDDVEDVVFQENQFVVTDAGGRYYNTEPNEDCYEALEMVLGGWDGSQGALYFESCENEGWHAHNLEYLYLEGGHRFYK